MSVTVTVDGKRARVETDNISLTGLLCRTRDHFRKGLSCTIGIRLNEYTRIRIAGKILRSTPLETAIAFCSMDEKSFSHLKRLVQYNMGDADLISLELTTPAFKK
jgi:hypothetical protein